MKTFRSKFKPWCVEKMKKVFFTISEHFKNSEKYSTPVWDIVQSEIKQITQVYINKNSCLSDQKGWLRCIVCCWTRTRWLKFFINSTSHNEGGKFLGRRWLEVTIQGNIGLFGPEAWKSLSLRSVYDIRFCC